MKKKYLAMVMGLMIAAMNVYAEAASEDVLTELTESSSEAAENDENAADSEAVENGENAADSEAVENDENAADSEAVENGENAIDNEAVENDENATDNEAVESNEDTGDSDTVATNGDAGDSQADENLEETIDQEAESVTGKVTEVGEDYIIISLAAPDEEGQAPDHMPDGDSQGLEETPGENEEQGSEETSGENEEQGSEETPGEDEEQGSEETPGEDEEQDSEETPGEDEEQGSEETPDEDEEQGSEETPGEEEQNSEAASGEEETMTISVTDETQILKQAMEMPEGGEPGKMNGEAPDGEASDEESADDDVSNAEGAGSEAPDDNGQNGGTPEFDGEAETISLAEIQTGDMVRVTLNSDGTAATILVQSMGQEFDGMGPGNGGMDQASGVDSYDAVQTIEEETALDGETIDSTGTDENAVLVDGGAEASLSNMTISRNSADSTGGDNASFYGVGAAVLAADGTVYLSDSTINTDASGGTGVFAYGDGTVYVADTNITTLQDTSGGIHAAGGGTLYAWNVTAETNGRSAATVRSDRGGGQMVIDGGSYTSNGADSPAVYCTADISIHDAELTANGSEAVCIEGLNTLRLYDCDLTGNMGDDERNDNIWTVIIYQSMSGDSEIGNGTFQMEGGTLTSGNGGIFYTTNTDSTITLKDVEIIKVEDSEFFLQCTGNNNSRGWGESGNNGADCLFTAISQEMQGDVIWDSISDLDFYMTEGSTLTGAFVNDETYAGEGGDGECNLYIGADSTWVVTGDSQVTTLNCEGTIEDENGNTVTVQGEDGTIYVEGDSEYTVTVESYNDSADLSGCSGTDTWEEHEVVWAEGQQ